jgi:ribose 5-phosphate isomerase A
MNLKYEAANQAVQYVKDGMTLGLGSGSTSAVFVDILGDKLKRGEIRDIVGVPTSEDTAQRARGLGIPLMKLEESASSPALPVLDLAVDGADEVDPQLNLIKGLGRALLREKITEIHARRFIVIVDESKIVSRLGRGPLPVEIVPFGAEVHVRWLNSLGCRAELWVEADGSPVVTDNHNYLARCWFDGGIPDAYALDRALAERPGIVEHGLFLDMATEVVVAGENGIRILERGR